MKAGPRHVRRSIGIGHNLPFLRGDGSFADSAAGEITTAFQSRRNIPTVRGVSALTENRIFAAVAAYSRGDAQGRRDQSDTAVSAARTPTSEVGATGTSRLAERLGYV